MGLANRRLNGSSSTSKLSPWPWGRSVSRVWLRRMLPNWAPARRMRPALGNRSHIYPIAKSEGLIGWLSPAHGPSIPRRWPCRACRLPGLPAHEPNGSLLKVGIGPDAGPRVRTRHEEPSQCANDDDRGDAPDRHIPPGSPIASTKSLVRWPPGALSEKNNATARTVVRLLADNVGGYLSKQFG